MVKEFEANNTKLLEEKNALYTQLQEALSSGGDAAEKLKKLNSQKADLESQVKELEDKLAHEEQSAGDLGAKKKKLES